MADVLKVKRGAKAKLPQLRYGEPAFVSDEGELYVGGEHGNVKVTHKQEVDALVSQMDDITKKINVSIRDYGAKTIQEEQAFDSTQSIQNAINYVSQHGGGTVEIPTDGTYMLSNIIVSENVTLYAKEIIHYFPTSTAKLMRVSDSTGVCIDTVRNSSLKNIFLDCNNADGLGINIKCEHSYNISVTNSGGDGVCLGTSNRVDNLYSYANKGNGVICDRIACDMMVKNMRIMNNGECGLVLPYYNKSNYFIDSTIEWNHVNNVKIGTASENVYFNNCFIDGAWEENIKIEGTETAREIFFSNCTIKRSNVYKNVKSHIIIKSPVQCITFSSCMFMNQKSDDGTQTHEVDYIIAGVNNIQANFINFVGSSLGSGYKIDILDKTGFSYVNGFSVVGCITKDGGFRGTVTFGNKYVLPDMLSSIKDDAGRNQTIYYDYTLKKIIVKYQDKYYDAMGNLVY